MIRPTVSCCIGDDVDKCDVVRSSQIDCDPRICFIRGAEYIRSGAEFRGLHSIHQYSGIPCSSIRGTGMSSLVDSNVVS